MSRNCRDSRFNNNLLVDFASVLNYLIAAVWFGFGLFCKVLGLVPRQREIVARILGDAHAKLLTKVIGSAEIGMAIWILTGVASKVNAMIQISIIASMNILEFFLAPDLLLWRRANAIFALMFILLIYFREFWLVGT
jgi:hypothetical protein